MDSNYHIFKKSVKSKGKTVHKWYFYWNDPITGTMHQKVCKGCKTQAEAYAYVSAQPALFQSFLSLNVTALKKMFFQLMSLVYCLTKQYGLKLVKQDILNILSLTKDIRQCISCFCVASIW